MNFSISFVIWALTGGTVGWLVARSGWHLTAVRSVMIGIASGLAGGLLWFPWFSSVEVRPETYLFELLSCNIFAGVFGSDLVFLALDWVHDRRSKNFQSN